MTKGVTVFKRMFRRYRKDESGAATVEFVLVFVPLIMIIFFIFEMAMAYHWALAAQKGVEKGARLAITQLPVHDTLVDTNGRIKTYDLAGTTVAGDLCLFTGRCTYVPTAVCTGGIYLDGACDATRFATLLSAVSQHAYGLRPENLTVSYRESGLGRATEPFVPIVTVTISSRAFPLGLSLFSVDTQLPAVSASLVGEFLQN